MSLDKAIAHGKEHRKPRPHGDRSCFDRTPRRGCPWCQQNRTRQGRRAAEQARAAIRAYQKGDQE